MKPVLWMKSTCSTCREAKAILAEQGMEVEIRDFARNPLTAADLEGLLPEDPTPMLGTRSPAFRALGLQGRHLSKNEAMALMLKDNNLLKRPVLVHKEGLIIGLDRAAYADLKGRP